MIKISPQFVKYVLKPIITKYKNSGFFGKTSEILRRENGNLKK